MDRKRRFSRLGGKLVGASLAGLVLAFVLYYLIYGLAVPWVLYSERFTEYWQERQELSLQSYQDYVSEQNLSVEQVVGDQDKGWSDVTTAVYTVVVGTLAEPFRAAEAAESADGVYYAFSVVPAVEAETDALSVHMLSDLKEIQCADGTVYISAAPNILWVESVGRIAGLALALAGFCAVMVPAVVRLLRRIEDLSGETGLLMAGDLSHSIRAPGSDELSSLGGDIERLRLSVLERIEGEREAVGANGRLITGLSHDLRTPLTKLMGYLEILRYHKYDTQAEHDAFLRMALEKTEQIKGLTDQLFARCQASSPAEGFAGPPEAVDGAALLGQLLSEQCCDLQREGFDAQPPVFGEDFTLYLRVEDVVRVFDNLFSNLRKYADPACPVDIRAELDPETVRLELENRILTASGGGDSHGCGLPTMRELMERGGGRLETERTGETYRTVLLFPKCKNL